MLDEALRPILPAVLALLDLPVEDAAWQALDPPQRRRRTLDGLKALLVRESQRQPLALVLEDLHWIDGETQALLDSLVESMSTCRILLLVNYRPEYRHGWGSRAHYTQLRIDPLEAAGAERAALGPARRCARSRGAASSGCWRRAKATRLFLEESVRNLVDAGVLSGARGAYRLVRQPDGIEVPASVAAIIAARIDRLSTAEKTALQLAAVIGEDVPLALLEAVVRAAGGRAARRARRPARARAPVRGAAVPGHRLRLQARAHPARRLRRPAAREPSRPARPHRRGSRDAPRRSPRRGRRDPGAPLRARRRVAEGRRVFPARRRQGEAALHLSERAGVRAAERARSPSAIRRSKPSRAQALELQGDLHSLIGELETANQSYDAAIALVDRRRGSASASSASGTAPASRSATAPGSPTTCTAPATRRCCSSIPSSTASRCFSRSSSGCARSSASSPSTRAAPAHRTRCSVPMASPSTPWTCAP